MNTSKNSPSSDADGSNSSPRTDALMKYEPWLRLIAKLEVDPKLRDKFSQSDVVQQTMMEAWRNWDRFQPEGDPQQARMAWLRRVLSNQLAMFERRYSTQKRDARRELSIEQSLTNSSMRLEGMLQANVSSPSQQLLRRERALQLATVLDQLPEDYREVIILRNLQEKTHAEIAALLGRGEGAVRMLWVRALAKLKQELDRIEAG